MFIFEFKCEYKSVHNFIMNCCIFVGVENDPSIHPHILSYQLTNFCHSSMNLCICFANIVSVWHSFSGFQSFHFHDYYSVFGIQYVNLYSGITGNLKFIKLSLTLQNFKILLKKVLRKILKFFFHKYFVFVEFCIPWKLGIRFILFNISFWL